LSEQTEKAPRALQNFETVQAKEAKVKKLSRDHGAGWIGI
jgi:hypothetical protein